MLKIVLLAGAIAMAAFALSVVGLTAWRSFQQPQAQEGASTEKPEAKPGNLSAPEKAEDAMARYTFWLTIFTGVLAFVALIQIGFLLSADDIATKAANAAKVSADGAIKAARVAQQTLIASQRAWIRIDKIGFGGGGLAIDQNGASVSVSFKITNVGNSPAINVTPHAWLVVLKNGGPSPLQEQQIRCSEVRAQPFGMGFTLFPAETFPDNVGAAAWSLGTNASREDIERGTEVTADKKGFALSVVGCVDYSFPTDPMTHHQTGFIFDVRQDMGLPIVLEDGIIPINRLRLMETGIGLGRYAD